MTAVVSESSTACTETARAPLSRAATSLASFRKETASSYSMSETSLPPASIALPYSSTATPTMLDSRFAGPSWAASGELDTEAIRPPMMAARVTRNLIPNEIIGLFRPTLVSALYGVGWSCRFEHHDGTGRGRGVGQRYPHVRHAQLGDPLGRTTVEGERRMLLAANDLDLPPADSPGERVAGQRLEGRLLGREAGGQVLGRERSREGVGDLVGGEQSAQRAVPLRVQQPIDPRDVDQVDPDAGDHARRQKRRRRGGGTGDADSAGPTAIQQRSASSNTRCAARVHSRHRASRAASPLARTSAAAEPNASNVPYSDSACSSSSASSARRSGALSG